MYILHPNNVGRYGHIANASYAILQASQEVSTSAKNSLKTASKKQENTTSA